MPPHGPNHAARVHSLLQEAEILRRNGSLVEAERRYRAILRLEPRSSDIRYNLGVLLQQLGHHQKALEEFRASVSVSGERPDSLVNMGMCLHELGRFGEAGEVYGRALSLDPAFAPAHNNMGNALHALGRRAEAIAAFEKATVADPRYAVAFVNLGNALKECSRVIDAISCYRSALEIYQSLADDANAGEHSSAFSNYLLALNYSDQHDAPTLFSEHRRFGERFQQPYAAPVTDRTWPRRLRIGYVSPDFRGHSVAAFFEPILAGHDRSRFEVHCYYNHRVKDKVTKRLQALAERWLDCADLSDSELAGRIRADRVDILVDLAGHTSRNRLLTFAAKPAPVQLSYLGYPNTTGLSAIDYRVSDARADPPEESESCSVEQLLRPGTTYFCYRPPANGPDVSELPSSASGRITFGCFNNLPKLGNAFLRAISQVLERVPRSRLLLKASSLDNPDIAGWLRARMAQAGMDTQRVELRGWEVQVETHLAAYGEVDIALDSFPYNGATTTCEALWMGVPVVTLAGGSHPARMGSSLLHSIGLDELIAGDSLAFVEKAAMLATDQGRLTGLRSTLRSRLAASPLMDEPGFTRALEACYLDIWQQKLLENR